MKNLVLLPHIRGKIDARVDRLLRDLDNPEPPLRLEDVRELLKLDLAYYTGEKDGFLAETIHRLRVAGKQVIARPTLVLDAIRKFSLKALYAPDRRRILIDDTVPKPKHRWIQGHEITHEILDWHLPVLRGDDELTLKQSCLAKIEAEANYGAGQLLFLRRQFTDRVVDSAPSIELVRNLASTFSNTHASTLWRVVETLGFQRPIVGILHYHPELPKQSDKFDPQNPCRHFVQSDSFAKEFSKITEHEVHEFIMTYCATRRGGPLGSGTAILVDDSGDEHEFVFETFNFVHECLTLGIHLRKRAATILV